MSAADYQWVRAQLPSRLPAGRVLFINADGLADLTLQERTDIEAVRFSTLRQAWLPAQQGIKAVCLHWHPAKQLSRMLLAMVSERVCAGTPVWIFGAGRSGIAGAAKLLTPPVWEKGQKVAYGGHGELWFAELLATQPPLGLAAWEERQVREVAGQELILVSLPGVFSHGKVDEGTRMLLEALPRLPDGARVHDFGCGCGIISAWLKLRQPDLAVSASDITALAYAATKATLRENGISAVSIHVHSGLAQLPGPWDVLVSNPPFHTGQEVDSSIAREFFAHAAHKLSRTGALYIVGNRFLPYQKALAAHFAEVKVLADSASYWVLAARGARA